VEPVLPLHPGKTEFGVSENLEIFAHPKFCFTDTYHSGKNCSTHTGRSGTIREGFYLALHISKMKRQKRIHKINAVLTIILCFRVFWQAYIEKSE